MVPMMSQPDADEVRLIEARAVPTRFARGWHCLGLIRDFGDGKPHAVNAFGQKLVIFRSADGNINVLDAYCRHMGGDLSHGEVKGNEIACPFHDWRWGGDGRMQAGAIQPAHTQTGAYGGLDDAATGRDVVRVE